jgi:hypothetical protein
LDFAFWFDFSGLDGFGFSRSGFRVFNRFQDFRNFVSRDSVLNLDLDGFGFFRFGFRVLLNSFFGWIWLF